VTSERLGIGAGGPGPGGVAGRRRVQRWVSGGFDPLPAPESPIRLVFGHGEQAGVEADAFPDLLDTLPYGGIGVLVPTYVARCSVDRQVAAVCHVLDRLAPIRVSRPALPITMWIGMQSDDQRADAAVERLQQLVQMPRPDADVSVVGLAIAGRGKLKTINATLRLTVGLRYRGWLWIDDDMELDQDCLDLLVSRFLEGGAVGAIGAHQTALASPTPPARLMGAVSQQTVPPTSYPAAGCMIVETGIIAGGIPLRRLADDGFVLFELLDAAPDGEPANFEVLAEAQCRLYRVGRSADTLRRLRRSLYSHATSMADYPWRTARRYFSDFLFYGLWPLAPWDNSRGVARGVVRWLIKAVHFGCFCVLAIGLVIRNLLGCPIREVSWGDDGDYRSPLTPPSATMHLDVAHDRA